MKKTIYLNQSVLSRKCDLHFGYLHHLVETGVIKVDAHDAAGFPLFDLDKLESIRAAVAKHRGVSLKEIEV
jgi:hypothetical protein